MTWLSDLWTKDEAFVLNLILKLKQDMIVVEADLKAANQWIVSNAPAISQNINNVLVASQVLGAAGLPIPAAAIAGANVAVAALNAYASSVQSTQSTTAAIVAGYTAVKQAQAAVAQASAAVAAMPAK